MPKSTELLFGSTSTSTSSVRRQTWHWKFFWSALGTVRSYYTLLLSSMYYVWYVYRYVGLHVRILPKSTWESYWL